MKTTFEELCKEIDSLMAIAMSELGPKYIKHMDPKEFATLQSALKLLDTSKKLMREFIDDHESKNKKLDEILCLLKKGKES